MPPEKENPSEDESQAPESHAVIPAGLGVGEIDLSFLPEEERKALVTKYAAGRVDTELKAAELGINVRALDATLQSLTQQANEAQQAGTAFQTTHVQDSVLGRTEIMVGNTDKARSGKFTKSQTGEQNWTPYYIGGGILAFIIVGLAIANSLGG
ncbi:MAG: hypothetical protein WD533_03975 [Dehalococcoidia bacterium]